MLDNFNYGRHLTYHDKVVLFCFNRITIANLVADFKQYCGFTFQIIVD